MQIPRVWNRKNRILLKELSKTDFKLRYQGSVLGYLWAVIKPLLTFVILYLVFGKFMRFGDGVPHYPLYLLTGIVLWNFFTECANQGIQAIVQRGELLRKISFPKYIVVLSATSTALINLGVNIVVIIVFALFNGIMPSWTWLVALLPILQLYILALGVSFLLGAINVKYRDITSIWEVLTQALFYAIPIIYPLSMVITNFPWAAKILLLNPIAQIIQDVRHLVITPTETVWNMIDNWWLKLIPIAITVILIIWGALYFRKKSKYFAEEA